MAADEGGAATAEAPEEYVDPRTLCASQEQWSKSFLDRPTRKQHKVPVTTKCVEYAFNSHGMPPRGAYVLPRPGPLATTSVPEWLALGLAKAPPTLTLALAQALLGPGPRRR
jgi:hypothetical protein